MRYSVRLRWLPVLATLVVLLAAPQHSFTQVTTPMEELGVNIGDDYHLFTYTQFEAYWRKTWSASDPESLWRRFQGAIDQHTRVWQTLLTQCGLMPGT